jgi:hypothetical protein
MRAKILLADSAEVREGLLFRLGGGWSETGPSPQPFAIAGLLEVEWDEANARHTVEFTIDDEDGGPLQVPTPTGEQPFKIVTEFQVRRPPGSPPGRSFNVPVAMPIMPIPWTPGRRYTLVLCINGTEVDRARFSVRANPPQPPPR